jgi:hypothetical protein
MAAMGKRAPGGGEVELMGGCASSIGAYVGEVVAAAGA